MQLKDAQLFRQQAYIDGQWLDADSGQTIAVNNPATGEIIGSVPKMGRAETRRAIEAAERALPAWSALTGIAPEQAVGHTSVALGLWVDEADRARFLQQIGGERFPHCALRFLHAKSCAQRLDVLARRPLRDQQQHRISRQPPCCCRHGKGHCKEAQ